MAGLASDDNKVVQPLCRASVQETLLDIHRPWSQEEVCCLGQTHCAQGLNLIASSRLSVALNTLIHGALAGSSLGVRKPEHQSHFSLILSLWTLSSFYLSLCFSFTYCPIDSILFPLLCSLQPVL